MKQQLPLLPLPLALDAIEELKGFVSSLFYSRDSRTHEAILKCLFEDDPMIKGPFIDLRLPYKAEDREWILHPKLKPLAYKKGVPFLHQSKSFDQLKSENAVNTLVTTGTGSGKSECFIFPLLDYVLRCKECGLNGGVKAIILYPMNALIEDQGERLSELANLLNKDLPTAQHIRIGRYTGNKGNTKEHTQDSPKAIIDDRESLIESPPDILLTNYRMLDFMLMRPQEQKFWNESTQRCFRYIVIDELHTFDGAQGADVSALLRRLKLKLKNAYLTCVGTSATMAAPQDGLNSDAALCEFASTLFGESFESNHVVKDEPLSIDEVLNISDNDRKLASNFQPRSEDLSHPYHHLFQTLVKKWDAPTNKKELGLWVIQQPELRTILEKRLKGDTLESLAERTGIDQQRLTEFLTLLSFAEHPSRNFAIIPQSIQVWSQGTKYLLRQLSREPEFIRTESSHLIKKEDSLYLPAVSCKACGASGWLTVLKQDLLSQNTLPSYTLSTSASEIFQAFNKKEAFILFEAFRDSDNPSYFYDPTFQRLVHKNDSARSEDLVPLHLANLKPTGPVANAFIGLNEKCPECHQNLTLSLGVMSTSMLGSVMTGHFLASPYNPSDKKFLIFNDSVQDAHHQAGYLSARGYRFNTRRYLYQLLHTLVPDGKPLILESFLNDVRKHISSLWDKAANQDGEGRTAATTLIQLLPRDLWERWHIETRSQIFKNNIKKAEFLDRFLWEVWMEMSIQSELGWSLRKTALVLLEPKQSLIDSWQKAVEMVEAQSPRLRIRNKSSFIYGLLRRFVLRGCIYHPELKDDYLAKNYSHWTYLRKKPYLGDILHFAQPHLISINETAGTNKLYERPSNISGHTWFKRWAEKHGLEAQSDIEQFYTLFLSNIFQHKRGIKIIGEDDSGVFALNENEFLVTVDHAVLRRCTVCAYLMAQDDSFKENEAVCTQMRCEGELHLQTDPKDIKAELNYRSYMKAHYKKEIVAPLAHPHTGQLVGQDRRDIEEAFKEGLIPGDKFKSNTRRVFRDHPVNVLTCTPTMEMGIDIGTLSGVALRSFPPTLSNLVQRLGRAGRSSGNSYNLIWLRDRAHDRAFWDNPNLYFKGQVKTPGCEFRNTQLLLRQFHAFLVDEFAGLFPHLKLPHALDLKATETLAGTPYWKGLIEFLKKCDRTEVIKFVDQVQKSSSASPLKDKDLIDFLIQSWKTKAFAEHLQLTLNVSDQKRLHTQKTEKELVQVDESHESSEIKPNEDQINQAEQKRTQNKWWKKQLENEDYILSLLSSEGWLPNYAFPEKGVTLSYNIRVKSADPKAKRPYQQLSKSIERPPRQGLSDLALNQYYYTDGFKVQISRLEKESEDKLTSMVSCKKCASLSEIIAEANELAVATCPLCGADQQAIINTLPLKRVSASDRFENSFIRDRDDDREKKPVSIETFFKINSNEPHRNQTWVSGTQRLVFDFTLDQEIYHLNRNVIFGQSAAYFNVCPDCYAMAYKTHEEHNQVRHIFQDKHLGNRHKPSCSHFDQPDLKPNEILSLTLSRSLKSDTMRVMADSFEAVPTLKATLRLSMKNYLKGEARHLQVEHSVLENDEVGQRHIVLLYDNVPGGTGNLRSLMQFDGSSIPKSLEGMTVLNEIFKKTFTQLSKCSCENGCYDCLLSFENQFDHKKIFKKTAVSWLERFIEANDWQADDQILTTLVQNDFRFGSPLEDKFVGLIKEGKWPVIDRVKEITEDGELHLILQTRNTKNKIVLVPTAYEKVTIANCRIPYTKPDFTLWINGTVASYIYLDGKEFHLNPKDDVCKFESVDVEARAALSAQLIESSPNEIKHVLTLTGSMLETLKDSNISADANISFARSLYQTLVQLFYHDTEPQFHLSELKSLIKRFTANAFNEIIQQSYCIFSDNEKAELRGILKTFGPRFKANRFGGLRYNQDSKNFRMDFSKALRTHHGPIIDENYEASWNLYWILFYIDPELVEPESRAAR